MTERVGPYELIAPIGSGGFATVWEALDPRLDARVAVKVLAENHALHPDVRARFLSEGRLLRRVDSPHLVTVYDVGETERGQPYLVLELADGGSLEERATVQAPTGGDVVALAQSMREALRAVHANSLVHRDIKPSNILIKSGGGGGEENGWLQPTERFVLADFGFAKDLALHSGLTVAGGTRHWSAPEQMSHGTVDARADLYSVGRVFEWMAQQAPDAAWAQPVMRAVAPALAADPEQRTIDLDELFTRVEQAAMSSNHATAPTAVGPAFAEAPLADDVEVAPAASSGRLRQRGVALAAAVAVLAALWFLVWPRVSGSPSATAVLDGEQVILEGPASIGVGSSAIYELIAPDDATITWSVTGVDTISDQRAVEIDGVEAGDLELEVEVRSATNASDAVVVGLEVAVVAVGPP